MNELLQKLSEATGVSGDEKQVRLLIRDLIAPHVDEWRVDAMGNLLALKKGTGETDWRVLVDAHMDEVGLMISNIGSDGMLDFLAVGGIQSQALLGKVVQVGPKRLSGVVGARPIHLLTGSQSDQTVSLDAMRIDIGASKKEQANGKVKIGDRATFVTKYRESGNIAIGKALDNRAGCAALITILQGERYPFDLHALFSVQEEIGLRGAETAGYAVQPDLALVLECTPAYDLPNKRDESPNVALGRGPSVYVMDSNAVQDPRLVSHILQTAATNDIPVQLRRPGGGGTNTGKLQRARAGIPAATIATPGRYLHSPAAMINLDDFANVIRLTDATLRGLNESLFQR